MSTTVIVRLPNWLGDTVMAVPAVEAIRAAIPEARLVLAGPWTSVLEGQGLADDAVVYPRRWMGRVHATDALVALNADIAVLFPNSFEAAAAAWYWGARRRIGYATGGRRWLLTDPLPLPPEPVHQVDEYLGLAAPLGAPAVDATPRLAAPPPDGPERAEARALLDGLGLGGGPVVGVHLGAAYGPSKTWPLDRVAELCRRLSRAGQRPVLLGAPADAASAEAVQASAKVPSLVGRDSPALLPALLAELDVLVCGDTGVGHLGAALGVPVVALFGPTDPVRSAPRGRVAVVHHPVPCAPCSYRACPIEHPCMRAITPEEVAARVDALLAASRTPVRA